MADLVHVDQRKWPDREHYQLEARWLGRDVAGGWIHVPAGTIVTWGEDEPWPLPGGFVALAPVDEWWVASFYPNHPDLSVCVDIATPPEWDGSRLTFIDLDLDHLPARRHGRDHRPGRVRREPHHVRLSRRVG